MGNSTENKEQWKQESKDTFTNIIFFSHFFSQVRCRSESFIAWRHHPHVLHHNMHTLKDDSLRESYASTFTAPTGSRDKNIWL